MARIILFIAAAVVLLVVLSMLFGTFMHLLVIGFWIVVVALLGFGLFRVGRRSASRK